MLKALFLVSFLLISSSMASNMNVLNGTLTVCSLKPLTGFTRNGYCETNRYDYGTHLICSTVTDEFLSFTKARGNDLSTPRSYFPGLKNGNNWCLCVFRWLQAYKSGVVTPVVLSATHKNSLDYLKSYNLSLGDLKKANNFYRSRSEIKAPRQIDSSEPRNQAS
jgi:uncharacterized protein (DUF2237 family)